MMKFSLLFLALTASSLVAGSPSAKTGLPDRIVPGTPFAPPFDNNDASNAASTGNGAHEDPHHFLNENPNVDIHRSEVLNNGNDEYVIEVNDDNSVENQNEDTSGEEAASEDVFDVDGVSIRSNDVAYCLRRAARRFPAIANPDDLSQKEMLGIARALRSTSCVRLLVRSHVSSSRGDISSLIPTLPGLLPSLFQLPNITKPSLPSFPWPFQLPNITKPSLPSFPFQFPQLPNITKPSLPGIGLPFQLPGVNLTKPTLPSFPFQLPGLNLTKPALPFQLPDVTKPSLPSLFPQTANRNGTLPNIFNWTLPGIFNLSGNPLLDWLNLTALPPLFPLQFPGNLTSKPSLFPTSSSSPPFGGLASLFNLPSLFSSASGTPAVGANPFAELLREAPEPTSAEQLYGYVVLANLAQQFQQAQADAWAQLQKEGGLPGAADPVRQTSGPGPTTVVCTPCPATTTVDIKVTITMITQCVGGTQLDCCGCVFKATIKAIFGSFAPRYPPATPSGGRVDPLDLVFYRK